MCHDVTRDTAAGSSELTGTVLFTVFFSANHVENRFFEEHLATVK